MGTKVKFPMNRYGQDGFSICRYCGQTYTRRGISNHWGHCSKRLDYINRQARIVASGGQVAKGEQQPLAFKPAPLYIICRQRVKDNVTEYMTGYVQPEQTSYWETLNGRVLSAYVFVTPRHARQIAKEFNGIVRRIS